MDRIEKANQLHQLLDLHVLSKFKTNPSGLFDEKVGLAFTYLVLSHSAQLQELKDLGTSILDQCIDEFNKSTEEQSYKDVQNLSIVIAILKNVNAIVEEVEDSLFEFDNFVKEHWKNLSLERAGGWNTMLYIFYLVYRAHTGKAHKYHQVLSEIMEDLLVKLDLMLYRYKQGLIVSVFRLQKDLQTLFTVVCLCKYHDRTEEILSYKIEEKIKNSRIVEYIQENWNDLTSYYQALTMILFDDISSNDKWQVIHLKKFTNHSELILFLFAKNVSDSLNCNHNIPQFIYDEGISKLCKLKKQWSRDAESIDVSQMTLTFLLSTTSLSINTEISLLTHIYNCVNKDFGVATFEQKGS